MALAAALLVGVLVQGAHATIGLGTIGYWAGQTAQVKGQVATVPAENRYDLKVQSVNGVPAAGRLRIYQRSSGLPPYGAVVSVKGKLGERRDGLQMTAQAHQIVQPPGLRPLAWLRSRLDRALKQGLPPREAALVAGLLFGNRSDLPPEWVEAFRRTGVYHVLVASGSNVLLILTPVFWLRPRLGRRLAALLAIPLALVYWGLTEGEPSVSRATAMIVVTLLGQALGRDTHPVASLSVAALGLLSFNPALLFDIAFQLSVAATLGILLFTLPISEWLQGRLRFPAWLATALAVTLAAQVTTEPLTLHYFGAVSVVAPLANLPVGWLLNLLVPAGCLLALAALVWAPVLLALWPGIWLLVAIVRLFAALPGAFVLIPPLPWAGVMIWYGALVALYLPSPKRRLLAALLAASLVVGWPVAHAMPPGVLRVTFLDVGQGDAIVVQAPDGTAMLVDAGHASPDWDAGQTRVLPFLRKQGVSRLAYAVMTHADQDHAGGMAAVLRAVPVGVLMEPGIPANSSGYRQALALPIPTRTPVYGEIIRMGGVAIEVLGPPARALMGTRSDTNANSIVLRVRYGTTSFLLTGDSEPETEEWLLSTGTNPRTDVLKVAHHGSGRSTGDRFLAAVKPGIAVISTGPNGFGHPDAKVLERLKSVRAAVYRTDRHGDVTVESDGRTLRVITSRREPVPAATPFFQRPLVGAW